MPPLSFRYTVRFEFALKVGKKNHLFGSPQIWKENIFFYVKIFFSENSDTIWNTYTIPSTLERDFLIRAVTSLFQTHGCTVVIGDDEKQINRVKIIFRHFRNPLRNTFFFSQDDRLLVFILTSERTAKVFVCCWGERLRCGFGFAGCDVTRAHLGGGCHPIDFAGYNYRFAGEKCQADMFVSRISRFETRISQHADAEVDW